MSTYEPKDNSGALFKNKDKDGSPEKEKWADYQGNIRVAGVDYYLSAGLNKSESGVSYMGVAVKPKEAQVKAVQEEIIDDSGPNDSAAFNDDEIPL